MLKKFYTHKFDNLDEWTNSFKNYKLLKPNQDEIDTRNIPITIKDIEFVVQNLPKNKFPVY